MLTVRWADGTESTRLVEREEGAMLVDLEHFRAGSGSWTAAMRRYTALGFEHILAGIDHLLFVLALLFVVRSTWQLVKTITAFTVAHSITLALATLGHVSLPPAPVEAAIALSIVFLCAEIERARQGRTGLTFSQPWLVAFALGLLHGLGFAGALSEIGLPPGEIPLALAFFNVGVELGQLAFVGGAMPVLWLLRRSTALAHAGRRAVVYFAGTVATVWFVERAVAIAPS